MPTDHRERLARIRRFDQLVAYLRDELSWPIDSDDFEDLTFEYSPEELGIDAKNAAKIQEIKRLRPLVPGQPWGIFFVKFEPKRLPVVALRPHPRPGGAQEARLGQQIRAPGLGGRRPALRLQLRRGRGAPHCLRALLEAPDGHDLPTLKVLGWDNLDTPLHLDAVARELTRTSPGPTTRTTPTPGASAGAPPSHCATAKSSPPRSSSPSA